MAVAVLQVLVICACGSFGAPYSLVTSTIVDTFVPVNESPTTVVPAAEMPTTEVPTTATSTTVVPASEMPTTEVPTNSTPTTVVPLTEVPTDVTPTAEVPTTEVPTTDRPTVKGLMTLLIEDAKDVCDRIRNIDVFENVVASMLSLRTSLGYQTKFNAYTETYNKDLEAVKDHMSFWRKGNDIVVEMRAIYERAKKFEGEFQRKFEIYRERLLGAPAASKRQKEALNEEIERLRKAKEHLKDTLATENLAVKQLVKDEIAKVKSKLEEKKKQRRNSSPLSLELKELVAFLGFVRDDAITVKDKTVTPAKKLGEMYKHIHSDDVTAHQYLANITTDVASLTSQNDEAENTIALMNEKLRKLQKHGEVLDAEKDNLRSALDELNVVMRNINSHLQEERKIYESDRELPCDPSGTHKQIKPPADWNSTRCDYIRHFAKTSHEEKVAGLRAQLNSALTESQSYLDELTELEPQEDNISEEMRSVRNSIPALRRRKEEIQAELRQFSMFQSDLKHLTSGIKSVLPYITKTQRGLLTVHTTFELVIEDLNRITGLAESADTEESRKQARKSAAEAINVLLEQMDGSSQMISDVNQCSTQAFNVSF